jgi:hypothetical protein
MMLVFDPNASQRICEVYDELVSSAASGQLSARTLAERIVWYVVLARCEKDINGFASVFEQGFNASEMDNLINGLRLLGDTTSANEFARGHDLLKVCGFYEHRDLRKISGAKELLGQIEENIGDRLWDLDVKMVALLDADKAGPDSERNL